MILLLEFESSEPRTIPRDSTKPKPRLPDHRIWIDPSYHHRQNDCAFWNPPTDQELTLPNVRLKSRFVNLSGTRRTVDIERRTRTEVRLSYNKEHGVGQKAIERITRNWGRLAGQLEKAANSNDHFFYLIERDSP